MTRSAKRKTDAVGRRQNDRRRPNTAPPGHGPVVPARFLTCAQFAWYNFEREFQHYDLADVMHMMAPPQRGKKGAKYGTLGGFCLNITPGVPFPELNDDNLRARWHEQVEALRRVGRLFDFFGIFDLAKRPEGPGYLALNCSMLPEDYAHMMERVGDLFIGWDLGEWDGLYGRDVTFYWTPEEQPKSRKEAYDRFMDYMRRFHGYVYRNACTIVGCTFPHYFHELPIRMLGAEVGQGLLNYQVYTSFLRGCKQQYGLESKIITSVFDRWGYTCYVKEGAGTCVMDDEQGGKIVFRGDAVSGHSLGLHFAMWITGYYADAAIMGLDGGYYTDELDERGVRKLSPLGQRWLEFREWARNPPPRGRQVRPLALLLDYHCGWTPPRHLYSMQHHTVWHSLPYGPCDYGTDRVYDHFYPGYTDSGFTRDERGFIAPTPAGDVIDVLLTDASDTALAAYPLLWWLSDEPATPDLLARLKRYVRRGGRLIVSATPAVGLVNAWFGQDLGPAEHQGIGTLWVADAPVRQRKAGTALNVPVVLGAEPIREGYFHVRRLSSDARWTILATTEEGRPVILTRTLGKGAVTLLTADHGLTDRLVALGLDMNPRWNYVPPAPCELLHAVERLIETEVERRLPVRVVTRGSGFKSGQGDGEGIYFSVNDLGAGTYSLCLYNTGHRPWEGEVIVPGQERWSLLPLPGCWSPARLRGTRVSLGPNLTTVLEVKRRAVKAGVSNWQPVALRSAP